MLRAGRRLQIAQHFVSDRRCQCYAPALARARRKTSDSRARTHAQKSRCAAPAGLCSAVASKEDKKNVFLSIDWSTTSYYQHYYNLLLITTSRLCVLTPRVIVPADQVVFAHVQRPVFRWFRILGLLIFWWAVSGFRVIRAVGVPRRIHLHAGGRRAVMHDHNNYRATAKTILCIKSAQQRRDYRKNYNNINVSIFNAVI